MHFCVESSVGAAGRRFAKAKAGIGERFLRVRPSQEERRSMRRSIALLLLGPIAVAAPLLVTSVAAADETGIAACGNIHVSAEAQCEAEFTGGCEANCTPVHFEAACTGECDGSCTAQIDASCEAECSGSCEAECEVDPGSLDCEGYCEGNCNADCEAQCGSDSGCQSSCQASCSGECSGHCSATPPSADCHAKCEASCSGHCDFEANIECDVSCHGECTANLEGGCTAQCQKPEGAVFCDGQYVDAGNNLDDCVNALKAQLGIEVTGYANASGDCSGNTCKGEAEAGCSCGPSSVANAPVSETTTFAAFAAGLGLLVSRRRRRQK